MLQMWAAYSAMVRSLENLPEAATLRIARPVCPGVPVVIQLEQPPVRVEVGLRVR
jgi:hypothetical protein